MTRTQLKIMVTVLFFVLVGAGITFATLSNRGNSGQTSSTGQQQGAGPVQQAQPAQPQPKPQTAPQQPQQPQQPPSSAKEQVPPAPQPSEGTETAGGSTQTPGSVSDQVKGITTGANNRPGMIEFGAEWCPPCKQMRPIVSEMQKKYKGKVDIVYVDVDQNPDLTRKYNITSIPVQLFFDKSGKQVDRHVGFYPKDQLDARLTQLVSGK